MQKKHVAPQETLKKSMFRKGMAGPSAPNPPPACTQCRAAWGDARPGAATEGHLVFQGWGLCALRACAKSTCMAFWTWITAIECSAAVRGASPRQLCSSALAMVIKTDLCNYTECLGWIPWSQLSVSRMQQVQDLPRPRSKVRGKGRKGKPSESLAWNPK